MSRWVDIMINRVGSIQILGVTLCTWPLSAISLVTLGLVEHDMHDKSSALGPFWQLDLKCA
jgi:hypothetical protein